MDLNTAETREIRNYMKSVFMLIYTSRAAVEVTPAVLSDLIKTSQARNAHDGITGLLVFRAGHFLQLLEGEESKVRALYADICDDSRHHSVILQGEALTESRIAPDWSMQLADDRQVAESEAILALLELGRRDQIYSNRTSIETALRLFAKDAKPITA